uniref:hypothetical protein n=1 Tax=Klebsiella pneumoniae TaxID=573 RepID=UPI0025A20F85
VPTANCEVDFTAPEQGWKVLGWGNGDPAFQYIERPVSETDSIRVTTFNGRAQVILGRPL